MENKKRYPNQKFRKLVKLLNEEREDKNKKEEEKIYQHREPKKIDWIAYNYSQINNIKESLNFIRKEVEKCNDPPRKVGRPIDAKLYTKAVLVCELFGLTERNAQGFIELFGSSLGILEKLDDRAIGNAYEKIEVAFILKQIFDKNKDSNRDLMGDGTGLETSRRQNYGDNKSSTKEFLTSIVDTREIVQAFDFSGEDEQKAMFDLVEQVKGEKLKLDAGFNNRELVRKIAEFGMIPFVYPKKINDMNGSKAWSDMYLEFFTDVIFWLQEYYMRVHCESFHSAFKRVFGIIRKTRPHSKFVQVIARIILHNRARLSYFNKIKKKKA
jgi:transposase